MHTTAPSRAKPPAPTFVELFTPKLVTVLREGYGLRQLRTDAIAGLTVAIVALPLSIAIAIASGAQPVQGLYAAIFGGFIVSALGGSRFQIGGPAGAFIVLVAATVSQHGMDGLLLAVLLSGLMLAAIGFLRLGEYIKFIPYPVTVGFTAGIAIIIFASQLKDMFGLQLSGPEPGPFLEKIPALWSASPTFHWQAFAIAAATIAIIETLKRLRPHWPGMLIAVVATALAAVFLNLPIETIGSRYGELPSTPPLPHLPAFSLEKVRDIFPAAIAFTLLGAIESLLSAVVADGMTGRRHRSNCELVAQGAANVASSLFGGICVTGTIARTATNVRAGAHGPVSGMLHSLFLLIFLVVAAPLAAYIPLASLAGVLGVVAWNMIEKPAIATLFRASRADAAVFAVTFGLTVFRDLTEAIVVGFALGSVLFIHRMSTATGVETDTPFVPSDKADTDDPRGAYHEAGADPDIVVYRITGVFFFGAAASVGSVLERIQDTHRALIIDFSAVPFVDSTAAHTIEGLAHKTRKRGVRLILSGASANVRHDLEAHGLEPPLVDYARDIDGARALLAEAAPPAR
ncbi:MAG: SulP family inorganic anion transporter [Hyphomonadaceae bacterium]